jgi:hypothetical protein
MSACGRFPGRDTCCPKDAKMAVHHPFDADGDPGLRPSGDRLVIEHAKGTLMLRYGIDSHQAFAVLLGWARSTHTPVHTVAHTLVHGICEGSPRTEQCQGALMRWLECRLRQNDPDPGEPSAPPRWTRTGG